MDTIITITINESSKKLSNDYNIDFDIKGDIKNGLDKTIVNSIRRVLLSSIPTVAFRTDMDSKDLHITKNTTSLHNELIENRIGLIPLYIDPFTYKKQYLFKLTIDGSNNDSPFKRVYMDDFNIYPLKDNVVIDEEDNDIDINNYDLQKPLSIKEKEKIFKPFVYKKKEYYCLITELKTTTSSIKQELDVVGIPRVSTASEDSRWQAVSCATYSFKRDPELFDKIIQEKIIVNEIPEEDQEEYKKSMAISESERYYHRDENCEPYWYQFKLDSTHYLPSKDLFTTSCQIIIDQLELLKDELPKINTGEDSLLTLKINENIYTLSIDGYNDTFGSIIQYYITTQLIDTKDSDFMVCGYKKVHPLEELIEFNVSFNSMKKSIGKLNNQQKLATFIKLFHDCCIGLITIYTSIKKEALENL